MDIINFYSKNAKTLAQQYNQIAPEQIHNSWLLFIPALPSYILDVGAGSGRDALWFAKMGHKVFAVEPAKGFREQNLQNSFSDKIKWIDDRLPDLNITKNLDIQFDLILVSAVWMHIPPDKRQTSFKTLAELLKPSSNMIITLRKGPASKGRKMYPVSLKELKLIAENTGFDVLQTSKSSDKFDRTEVSWTAVVMEKQHEFHF